MSTKEQERKALEKIREIIVSLGADSYVGTAVEGCLEIAEENITNDFADSMKQRWQKCKEKCAILDEELTRLKNKNAEQSNMIERLSRELEREQEWKPYTDSLSFSDEEYEKLIQGCEDIGRVSMTDDEAKEEIRCEFGFELERIKICRVKPVYEINRHSLLRQCETKVRHPYYFASDWNYIRFECGGYTWEMVNGGLHNVT